MDTGRTGGADATGSAPGGRLGAGVRIHPTAIVDDGAQIGDASQVWHWSHVMPGARIGKRCNLGQNVFVANGTSMGDNVKVQNNVSIYEGVHLGDDVFCGPSMVFTNVVNPRSHVSRKHEYRQTRVGRGASFGANSTVVCGHDVGRFAFVAAGSVVTKEIPDYAMVMGVPGRVVGYVCACGVRLAVKPGDTPRSATCPECAVRYHWDGSRLVEAV
ncbi:MAG: acetyltransferase [Planctomycetes bacterium]|nr:acetyltransferase [Planctomycetota bacterium]